jgi:transketolase
MTENIKIEKLKIDAKEIRKDLLKMAYKSRAGHISSSLSAVDIITALYFDVLKINPKKPNWPKRDIFILSKGHGCLGYYAALARRGYFPKAVLADFFKDGTVLSAHPTVGSVAGIEFSTGSLGHGLAVAGGMAYGFKLAKKSNRVVVMLSDGECDEGATWEAAMSAGHLSLDNLAAVIDYNKKQAFGRTQDVMSLEPLADKWRSFGWNVLEIDGHNFSQILKSFKAAVAIKNKPTVIIAHTVKGKGVDFMEDTVEWHYLNLDEEKYNLAINQL